MKSYDVVMVNKRDRISAEPGSFVLHAVGREENYKSRGQGVVHDQATRRQNAHRYGWMKRRHQIATVLKPVYEPAVEWKLYSKV